MFDRDSAIPGYQMYTSCPKCQTVFRVRPEDLGRARGRVRCGRCKHTFDALGRLSDQPPRPGPAAPPPDTRPADEAATPESPTPRQPPATGPEPEVDWGASTWRRRQLSMSAAAMGASWPLISEEEAPARRPKAPEERAPDTPVAGDAKEVGADPWKELEQALEDALSGAGREHLPEDDSAESFSASLERLILETEMAGGAEPGYGQEIILEFPREAETEAEFDPDAEPGPDPEAEVDPGTAEECDLERLLALDAEDEPGEAPEPEVEPGMAEESDLERLPAPEAEDAPGQAPEPAVILAEDPPRDSGPLAGQLAQPPGQDWDALFFDDDHGIPDTDHAPSSEIGAGGPEDTTPGPSRDVDFPSQDQWFDPTTTLSGEDFADVDWRNPVDDEPGIDSAPPQAPGQPGSPPGEDGESGAETGAGWLDAVQDITPLSDEVEEPDAAHGDAQAAAVESPPAAGEADQVPDDVADGMDSEVPDEAAGDESGVDFAAPEAGDLEDHATEEEDQDAEQELISPLEAGLELATSGTWEQVDLAQLGIADLPQDDDREPDEQAPAAEPEGGYSAADLELLAAIERMEAGQDDADGQQGATEAWQPLDLDDALEPDDAAQAPPPSPEQASPRAIPSTLSEVQHELRALARLFESGPDRSEPDQAAELADPDREQASAHISHILRAGPSRRARILTLLACLALLAALAAQLLHYRRDSLLLHPTWGPRLGQVYASLGVELPEQWELDKYDVRQLGGMQDPDNPGTLLIGISLRNRAARDQPFPVIRLVLEDRWGQQLGKLDISPAQYLAEATLADRPMRAGEFLRAELGIVDPPGGGATNFQIDACLPRRDGQLDCANRL